MIAVDTNVLARLILHDDPAQHELARSIVREDAFVSLTVLLETAWLLRSRYGQPREAIVAALRAVAAIPTVVIEAGEHLGWALQQHLDGADIADVIHLLAARTLPGFATFDRRMGALSAGSPVPVTVLR